jgi:hypothetical protein
MKHWLEKVVELLNANTADLRELAIIAGGNPKNFYHGIDPDELDLVGQDIDGIEFENKTADEITEIRSKRSKEERIVLLLDRILQSRTESVQIIDNYVDNSIYANMALVEIRKELLREVVTGRKVKNVSLIRALRRPLNHQLADSRVNLMYYMSKHLSKYPDIRMYLQRSYRRYTSERIDRYRPDIENFLGIDRPEIRG